MKLFSYELKKMIRQHYLLLGFGSMLVFGLLGFLHHLGSTGAGPLDVAVTNIGNATETLFVLFPIAFCGFIFSEEYRLKTMKVVKPKLKGGLPLFTAKVGAAVLSSLVLFAFYYAVSMLLGGFIDSASTEAVIRETGTPVSQDGIVTALGFFCQAWANLYLVALVTVLTILFRSAIIGFGGGLFILIADLLASNIEALVPVLPLSHFYVWKKVITDRPDYGAAFADLGILAAYSLLIFCIAAIVHIKREEKG